MVAKTTISHPLTPQLHLVGEEIVSSMHRATQRPLGQEKKKCASVLIQFCVPCSTPV